MEEEVGAEIKERKEIKLKIKIYYIGKKLGCILRI